MATVIAVVGGLIKFISVPIKNTYNYLQNYENNVSQVETRVGVLENHRNDINTKWLQVSEEEELTKVGAHWLDRVSELLDKDAKLKKIKDRRSYGDGMCRGGNNPYTRYKWSKEAEKLHGKIQVLLDEIPPKVSEPFSVGIAREKINEYKSFEFKSRQLIMDEVVNKLLSDQVYVVGLYGNAHVGKTKMAKDIMKIERVKREFGTRIAMVEVFETPNKKEIQDKIVEAINRDWRDIDNVALRAMLLTIRIHYYKNDKMLIILDHIWGKLNLLSLGIVPAKNCKVLVISRMKNVCEAMEAKEEDILRLERLSVDESRHLFWTRVCPDSESMVDQITNGEYLSLGDKLLKNYCQGLPLAVVALAKLLRDQSLLQWQNLTTELETKGRRHEVFHSIWDKNFELLEKNKEKKMFFLLTCLFPQESPDIEIQELMRYAMGLDLIQCVNNLTQAITLANTWVHQLISSSLLDVDDENCEHGHVVKVILPRLVREQAFSSLEKEGHKFLVEAIPRWHTEETCRNYTGISLKYDCNHSRLSELNLDKLQILVLKESQPQDQFADAFFKGMTNLKVLVLKGMKLQPHLPSSIDRPLKNLRSLHLEACELGTIKWAKDELVNLVVLSLRESTMVELPAEVMRNCHKLRLLDLSKCKIQKGIPADVLGRLSQLEGLYTFDCFEDWATESHENDLDIKISGSDSTEGNATAGISELNDMNYLNVLELKVRDPCQLPVQGAEFVKNLNQFHICVSAERAERASPGFCRILQFRYIEVSSISLYTCVRGLLKKSEMLKVAKVKKLQHFIDTEAKDRFKFQNLQELEIKECPQMQFFSHTPFKAPNLSVLSVVLCASLKFFFETLDPEDKDRVIEFPNLKVMVLHNLQNLETVLSESNCTAADNNPQGKEDPYQPFFHPKITFPKLEELDLHELDQIVKLWDIRCKEHDYISSFKNLKTIVIWGCAKLEVLASFAIAAALEQVKDLTIVDCPNMKSAITKEETEDVELIHPQQLFPSLETVLLGKCSLLQFFITGIKNHPGLELPALQFFEINECAAMQNLSSMTLNAPQLCQVTVNGEEHIDVPNNGQENQDMNSFLHSCFQNQLKPSDE